MQLFTHIAIILAVSAIVAVMIVWPDTHNGWHWLAAAAVIGAAIMAVQRTLHAETEKARTIVRRVERHK